MSEKLLPVNLAEARARGWEWVDFVFVTGDAYVDHPSFGPALLGRVLQKAGYRVGMLPQPNVNEPRCLLEFGAPRLGFLVSGGVVDSMVAHYTVAKRRRHFDEYSPGGKTGLRPDRATEIYAQCLKKLLPDTPVVIGGIEASLRRFAHYDYWQDAVLPSILETSGADLLCFGMGERPLVQLAGRLAAGEKIAEIRDIPGTAFLAGFEALPQSYAECAAYAKVKVDKTAYAKAVRIQHDNQDPQSAKPLVQRQSGGYLVQNLPAQPLGREELDEVYALPFTRKIHPMYEAQGGVPALEEVEFSIAQNRGCFGGCHFCAITLHQGRRVTSRSEESIVEEARLLTAMPGFKGYIHDVGGPTANFRAPSCKGQLKNGVCPGAKRCLAPAPCQKLEVSHEEYLSVLRKLRALPGVKKVFIRSGLRFDYLLQDRDGRFLEELVRHHVSGQLKVAPEHCSPAVLRAMAKPPIEVYERFARRFYQLSKQAGKEQYLVPYLMSSHPGSTLRDAVLLAQWLHKNHIRPEQVQDFYPTPGTISTAMYYTGLDPYTLREVYVAKTQEEKAIQRALLQYSLPGNRPLVKKALLRAGRPELLPILLPGEKTPGAERRAEEEKPLRKGQRAARTAREPQRPGSGARGKNARKNAPMKEKREDETYGKAKNGRQKRRR